MSTPLMVICAALGGAVAGAVGGVLAAIVTLTARRLRNRVLVDRSLPVPRDMRFPTMFVKLCGVLGLLISGGLAIPLGLYLALLLAAVPAICLAVLGIGFSISDAREARRATRKPPKAA